MIGYCILYIYDEQKTMQARVLPTGWTDRAKAVSFLKDAMAVSSAHPSYLSAEMEHEELLVVRYKENTEVYRLCEVTFE